MIFKTNEGDFEGTPVKKPIIDKNSAMNFRNSEILTLRCLEGRKSYQKVKSVSKSDKNWICYSDIFLKSLFLKQSLAELKMQFSKMVNF